MVKVRITREAPVLAGIGLETRTPVTGEATETFDCARYNSLAMESGFMVVHLFDEKGHCTQAIGRVVHVKEIP